MGGLYGGEVSMGGVYGGVECPWEAWRLSVSLVVYTWYHRDRLHPKLVSVCTYM